MAQPVVLCLCFDKKLFAFEFMSDACELYDM